MSGPRNSLPTPDDVIEFLNKLRAAGVHTFEGKSIKVTFAPSFSPFTPLDPAKQDEFVHRQKLEDAVERFAKGAAENDADLLWST